MLRKWLCQAEISIAIELVDPVLVKSGYATMDGVDMVPVSTVRNGQTTYYLPGPSLKGVLRSHFERIARTLQSGSVCLPYYDPKRSVSIPVDEESNSFGCGFRSRGQRGENKDSASMAYADSCAACRLFGSLKFGGRFSIGDAYPFVGDEPVIDTRNCVGIDRFTGGAVPGALFDLQVLVGGKFEASIRLTNFEIWQLASVKLLLDDMADELITIGSGRSRGLGRVRAAVKTFRLSYLRGVNSLVGIGQLATPAEQQAYLLHDWTPDARVELSAAVVKGLREYYVLDDDWAPRLQVLVPAFHAFLEWHSGPCGEASGAPRRHR